MAKKKMKIKNKTTLFLHDLPADLKYQYKAWCAKRGKSMKQDIIEHMEARVCG